MENTYNYIVTFTLNEVYQVMNQEWAIHSAYEADIEPYNAPQEAESQVRSTLLPVVNQAYMNLRLHIAPYVVASTEQITGDVPAVEIEVRFTHEQEPYLLQTLKDSMVLAIANYVLWQYYGSVIHSEIHCTAWLRYRSDALMLFAHDANR